MDLKPPPAVEHAELHTIASHTDTTATGLQLNELVSGGNTTLHTHSAYQPLDAELTSLAGLTYAAPAFVKMTGANTFVLRAIAQTAADLQGTIDHNSLANYAANRHFLQTEITVVGTIAAGVWQGTSIAVGYTDAKCTDATADNTAANQTSHATVVVDGDFGSNGILNRTGAGAYSILALGTDVQAYHANLAAIAAGTWTGASSIITLGTVTTCGGITLADGAVIRCAGAPVLTFNDTTNKLGITGGIVGIGLNDPDGGGLHVTGTVFPSTILERTTDDVALTKGAVALRITTSGDMVDGFGGGFIFQIQDDADTPNNIGAVYALRDGADNVGQLQFYAGVLLLRMAVKNSGVFMYNLKSGTDQANAGAAINELYRDTDDNSIKIGV